ncbi:Protein-lysine N-methyltransferase efm4, variant 2 [Stygiomarasmius scandens]
MVEWAEENLPPSGDLSILEIGSGNGTLLFALAEAGYSQKSLSGVDYSPDAVKLSKAIAATREMRDIQFNVCDFLNQDPPVLPKVTGDTLRNWDLLLDKGTYDAIALGVKDEEGNSPASRYPARVARLLKPGGIFLITSCNFTEDELKAAFDTNETGLKYHSRIQHPTFSFGGKSGSIVSSVAFQRS